MPLPFLKPRRSRVYQAMLMAGLACFIHAYYETLAAVCMGGWQWTGLPLPSVLLQEARRAIDS